MYILSSLDDKDCRDTYGRTSLHHMAQLNNAEGFKLLIGMVHDKNPKDDNNETPLHVASRLNNIEIVICISKHLSIAQMNPRNKAGHTPLSIAYAKKHSKIYHFLKNTKAES